MLLGEPVGTPLTIIPARPKIKFLWQMSHPENFFPLLSYLGKVARVRVWATGFDLGMPGGVVVTSAFVRLFHMIIRRFRAAALGLAALLILAIAMPQAGAATFAEDAQAAAAKGSVKLNDIPAIKSFLGKFGARKLGNLQLNNAKFEGGVLKADVKFININWRFTAYSGGTLKNTFFTFGPTSTVSFKKMFKKVPGIELLDILVFDDQMLAIAGADLEIDAGDLPDGARGEIDRFYEGGDDYTFEIAQGLKLFGALDLGKAKALSDAIKFLGGKSSKVQLTAALSTSVLDAMLGGSLPKPEMTLTAALPTFRPKIGGLIQLPANVQFSFNSSLSTEGASVGFAGTTDFKIGGQTVPMTLQESITLDTSGAPEIGVTLSIFEGEPWKKAFGLKFLTIEDYAMEMTADASGTLSVGTSGKTSIGGKTFDVATSAQIGTTTAGFRLVTRHSNQCLDISGGNKNNKGAYIQWSCHNGGNQLFKFY